MASGDLRVGYVLPVIRKLSESEEGGISDSELLEMLQQQPGGVTEELRDEIETVLYRKMLEYHDLKKSGAAIPQELCDSLKDFPLDRIAGWRERADLLPGLNKAFKCFRDYAFTLKYQGKLPQIQEKLKNELKALTGELMKMPEWGYIFSRQRFEKMLGHIAAEYPKLDLPSGVLRERFDAEESGKRVRITQALDELPKALPEDLDERLALEIISTHYESSRDEKEKKELLDLLCTWPANSVIPVLKALINAPRSKERAVMILTLRFGQPELREWSDWREWLNESGAKYHDFISEIDAFAEKHPEQLLAFWYANQEKRNPLVMDSLAELCELKAGKISPDEFLGRYSARLDENEKKTISDTAEEKVKTEPPAVVSPPLPPKTQAAAPPPVPAEKKKTETEISSPSLWQDHIQPFFAENWYMVAGIFMVIAGSSLLAFYTWDKHWLVPYTIMPLLLAFFTAGLAGAGSWVEKRGREFLGMAAMLRGAAIGLLPVNFMAVALLSNDDRVSHKVIIVPLMGLIYLFFGGWGLKRWCSAIHKSLGKLLGMTLLLLNALVIIGPLAKSFKGIESGGLNLILGTGFYLGFGVMAFAVIRFTRDILDRKMAAEKRIPWFFGATLVVTFLQVFAWVHGHLGYLPRVYTYAPMVILTGGLVLLVEKRSLLLKETRTMHEMESFLGFALIFVGVLMGASDNAVRILSFELAGIIWLFQAFSRKHPLHYWISLTFIVLGASSVALLKTSTGIWLPTKQWLPVLGIAVSLLMSGFIYLGEKYKDQLLREAACGMQTVILALTAVVAVLAQWHYASKPLLSALYLVVVTAVFLWRAFRDEKLRWLHTAMLVLALALPYMGCVDVMNKTLHGNSMVFGLAVLSFLWLGAVWLLKHPLLIKARSTVVFFYGVTALAAMIVRVVIQRGVPGNVFMDYTGPLLIAAALTVITYYSRSLIPAAIAAFILVILFPELRSHFKEEFDRLGWGTGFGSAWSATGLLIAAFITRELKFLKNLDKGDLFLGKAPFYFRRFDHTLFTWPLLVSAVFLMSKTDTITFAQNLMPKGYINYETLTRVPLKASLAVLITGFCWTLLGIYYRRYRQAVVGVHLGWIFGLAGTVCCYYSLAPEPHWTEAALLAVLIIQAIYFLYSFGLQKNLPWAEELLTRPMLQVLRYGSPLLAAACIGGVIFLKPSLLLPLSVFAAVQLVWHGIKTRDIFYGACLYFLLWFNLLAWANPGTKYLFARLENCPQFVPMLYFLLAVQLIHIVLEFRRDLYEKLKPLMTPFMFLSSLFVVLAALSGLADAFYSVHFSGFERVLLLILIFVTARAQAASPLALSGVLLAYLYMHPFPENTGLIVGIDMLILPWKLAVLGFVLMLLGQYGRELHSRFKRLMEGPFGQPFYREPSIAWFFIPAAAFAFIAALYQTFHPEFRSDPLQACSPFISAAAIGGVAYFWRFPALLWPAIAFWGLGNIHMLRIYTGDFFLARGLSYIHLACLGLAATMLESSLLKVLLRKQKVSEYVNRACLLIAFLVICMLSANYFVNPNLADISWARFAVSGSMTLIAGLYFRRAARRPGPGEENAVVMCEAFYHYGVSMTIWCLALMIPWFRTPATALFALGLPVLYFYLHAEANERSDKDIAGRYRNSAATLSFIILALYLFRFAFRMMLFPDNAIDLMHYHYSAPVIMLLALLMFRLRGLGGTSWLAFYGGLALMAGAYFTFTWFPKLSPFDHALNGAWCAVIFSHFWTLLSYERSPVRTAIQLMGRISDESWYRLRRGWGYCLIWFTQIAMLWGLLNCGDTYMIAPLLAGGASIFIHQGIIKSSRFYYGMAAFELLLALHAGFLVPSWLPKEYVIWSVVCIWAAMLAVHEILRRKFAFRGLSGIYVGLAVLLMVHVLYHEPNSAVGLWAFAAGALLAALTPIGSRSASHEVGLLSAVLLPWVPAWLIFFSQTEDEKFFTAWALLLTAAAFFATGILAKYYQSSLSSEYEKIERPVPRLFDRTLMWLGESGSKVNIFTLGLTLLIIFAVTLTNYRGGLEPYDFVLVLVLYLGSALAWYSEGMRLEKMSPFFVMQFCLFMSYVAVRRQIVLAMPDFWRDEYDVWVSLIAAAIVSGLLQVRLFKARETRIPLTFLLCALPVLALVWTLSHHLGTNTLLLLIGLYSMIFVFMGKDDRESPYHIVAVSGFVAFLLILFWNKLEIRVIHAYVIPAGAGVLVLLQLFRERIMPQVRNQVRFITLMAMLGSSGYYVLIGSDINIIYVMVFGVLGLFAMILGSVMRIRLYLILGFTGLIVNVCVIFCKLVIRMQRNTQMTIIGSLVLIAGVAIVSGAVFYKTHREKIMAFVNDTLKKLQSWE